MGKYIDMTSSYLLKPTKKQEKRKKKMERNSIPNLTSNAKQMLNTRTTKYIM